MSGTVIATGGGEIADEEPRTIDERVVEVAPGHTALFLPTASGDAQAYVEAFERYYADLGCSVETCRLTDPETGPEAARRAIEAADIVYAGGGDTGLLVDTVRTLGLVDALRAHHADGGVLTGLSAGALCWAAGGLCDAVAAPDVEVGPVTGFDILEGLHLTVHADPQRTRRFRRYLARRSLSGVAIGDRAALEVTGDRYRVLTAGPEAAVYHVDPERAAPVRPLPEEGSSAPLSALR